MQVETSRPVFVRRLCNTFRALEQWITLYITIVPPCVFLPGVKVFKKIKVLQFYTLEIRTFGQGQYASSVNKGKMSILQPTTLELENESKQQNTHKN